MSFLDVLLNGVKNVAIGGTLITITGPAPTLNFVSGATGVYNATTNSYDITITGGGGGSTPTGVDVKGASASTFYVGSISGFSAAGGTIPVHAKTLQFDNAQNSPGIAIQTVGSDVAATTLFITGQPAFSNTATHPPGDIEIAIGHATSGVGGGSGGFAVSEGGARFFRVDNGTGGSGTTSIWLAVGVGSPSPTNWAIQYNPSADPTPALIYASPNANSAQLSIYDAGNAIITTGLTGNQVALSAEANSTGPSSSIMSADLNENLHNQIGAFVFADGRHNTCLNVLGSSSFTTTNVPSGEGVTFFANATTNPTSTPSGGAELYATGGQLWVYQSDGTNFQITTGGGGGVTWGSDLLGSSSIGGHQWVAALSGQGGSTAAIPLRSGAYISVTDGQPIVGDGTTTFIATTAGSALHLNGSASGGVQIQVSGTTVLDVESSSVNLNVNKLQFSQTVDSLLEFASPVSGTGSNLWLVGQQSSGGPSGNVNVRVFSPGGGSTEALFQVMRNAGSDVMQIAMGYASSTISAIWGHGVTPGAGNYAIGITAINLILNAPTTGILMSIAGTVFGQFGAASSDFLSMGATPASSGYLRLTGVSSSTKTLIATSNHNNSATVAICMIDSSDNLTFGDATNGDQVTIAAGASQAVTLTQGGSSIAAFSSSLITFDAEINFNGGALATSATAGTHGAVPAQVLGYLPAEFQGSAGKIPVFNT